MTMKQVKDDNDSARDLINFKNWE